jgi:hypothetical protein
MTIDLCGIPFHLVDNVDFVGATEKHLFIVDDQRWDRRGSIWKRPHTIKALARVLPTLTKEPGC